MSNAPVRLGEIRHSLDGAIPAVMSTCAPDGTPNVVYISQAFYVDEDHVALSFQFFNKTRQNILANPYAQLVLLDPRTAAYFRLDLRYLRTETEGPLFEGMRAQLAGIASHVGMESVFRLRGSDIYAVERIDALAGDPLPVPPPRCGLLAAARRSSERLSRCAMLDDALQAVLATLADTLGVAHAMVLMLDPRTQRLYTVASSGYPTSGVGFEIGLGQGVIGVAARERTPVRIMHMTNAALYSQALRHHLEAEDGFEAETEIPYPGLAHPASQMAAPVLSQGRLLGVLFVESPLDLQFGFEEEDLLVAIAGHLGAAIDLLQAASESAPEAAPPPAGAPPALAGEALAVRHFGANDSVFLGEAYLIKGVAGAILWKLLREHAASGRCEFSNRELRLDPAIGLPDVTDNLEARLVLLRRRLDEHGSQLRIEKTGRGRFRLKVGRPLTLVDAG